MLFDQPAAYLSVSCRRLLHHRLRDVGVLAIADDRNPVVHPDAKTAADGVSSAGGIFGQHVVSVAQLTMRQSVPLGIKMAAK